MPVIALQTAKVQHGLLKTLTKIAVALEANHGQQEGVFHGKGQCCDASRLLLLLLL